MNIFLILDKGKKQSTFYFFPLKRQQKGVLLYCFLASIRMYSTAVQSWEYLQIYLNESPRKGPKTSQVCIF